jgi:hypothetical protein
VSVISHQPRQPRRRHRGRFAHASRGRMRPSTQQRFQLTLAGRCDMFLPALEPRVARMGRPGFKPLVATDARLGGSACRAARCCRIADVAARCALRDATGGTAERRRGRSWIRSRTAPPSDAGLIPDAVVAVPAAGCGAGRWDGKTMFDNCAGGMAAVQGHWRGRLRAPRRPAARTRARGSCVARRTRTGPRSHASCRPSSCRRSR